MEIVLVLFLILLRFCFSFCPVASALLAETTVDVMLMFLLCKRDRLRFFFYFSLLCFFVIDESGVHCLDKLCSAAGLAFGRVVCDAYSVV